MSATDLSVLEKAEIGEGDGDPEAGVDAGGVLDCGVDLDVPRDGADGEERGAVVEGEEGCEVGV